MHLPVAHRRQKEETMLWQQTWDASDLPPQNSPLAPAAWPAIWKSLTNSMLAASALMVMVRARNDMLVLIPGIHTVEKSGEVET